MYRDSFIKDMSNHHAAFRSDSLSNEERRYTHPLFPMSIISLGGTVTSFLTVCDDECVVAEINRPMQEKKIVRDIWYVIYFSF
jgi:hypothetical protein